MLRRLEPRFLFRSGYSHSCLSREQVPHFGLTRSHFNFRFRHDTQDMVLSDGGGALVVVLFVVPAADKPVLPSWGSASQSCDEEEEL